MIQYSCFTYYNELWIFVVNIVSRYIIKNLVKTQITIFCILISVFMCQTFIKFISSSVKGAIPSSLISDLLLLSIPTMSNFMLPLSLFLAILFSIGNMCSQSEMVVFNSCGFSRKKLLVIVFIISVFTAGISGFCSLYLSPYCEAKQVELIDRARKDPKKFSVDKGRFLKIQDSVIYVEDIDDTDNLQNVYILTKVKNDNTIIVSKKAYVTFDKDNFMWLHLVDGTSYGGPTKDGEFRVSDFERLTLLTVEHDSTNDYVRDKVNTMYTNELISGGKPVHKAELQWRIVQPLSIIVLCLMIVPLSMVNPRQGRFAKFLPAICLYLSYYLLCFSARSGISKETIPEYPGIYIVLVLYFIIFTIPFNLKETEWYNKLRANYKAKRIKNV
ncbi:MAG: LPS export ABC transporter permease LptF [Succinivibrionaceae bacterium]